MNFTYSRQGLKPAQEVLQRFFEILPASTSWLLIVGLFVVALWQPVVSSMIVIVFMLSWIFRLFYYWIFLMLSYARLKYEQNTDWLARIRGLDRFGEYYKEIKNRKKPNGLGALLSDLSLRHGLDRIREHKVPLPHSEDVHHLVIIPVAKESPEVLLGNIRGLMRNTALLKQMIVVIALEQRADASVKAGARALADRYREKFLEFQIIEHPEGLPGEARVKGANTSFAAKTAAEFLKRKDIPYENVVVSCFDADTIVGADYFACLTYCFMICPDRHRASFQPIPVFHNNIWEVPGFARVIETGSSFFQLVETTNPEKLVTFSSHSMSFRALVDVGYWPVDMISDDSGIFWKAYLYFDGHYQVVPLPVTLSMDVVDAGSWWKTVVSLYKQKRRWAWGVENFPLVMRGFLKNKKISLYDKVRHAFKMFEGHVTWAALPLLLTFVGWIPAFLAGREFAGTVLYYNASRVTQAIFGLSSMAVLGTVILSVWLLPPSRKRYSLIWKLVHALEWFLVPFILVFLSALPALDAQTRLMLGNRMEFWVSDKRRL